jgi:RNA polymerase sigma factor (sigma-70 family)
MNEPRRALSDGPDHRDDREALERAIASQRTYLMFVAGKLKGSHLQAIEGVSDLVQRTFLAALEKVRRGDDGLPGRADGAVRAWLRRILKNNYYDMIKFYNAVKRTPAGAAPAREPLSPSGEATLKEAARRLDEAREAIPPGDREILAWKDDEQLTFREIGRRRGYSTTRAHRAYHEARERFESVYRGDAPPSSS